MAKVSHSRRPLRATLIALLSTVLGVSLAMVSQPSAQAVTYNMLDNTSSHVTADALPTVQIDSGVVWTTVISGNTVYAGGQFTQTRPAGAAAGTSLTPRNNLLAFDLTTGNLTSFNVNVNGVVKALALSPDQKTLYIGGNFSSVNGTPRTHFAAVDAATGALLALKPLVNTTVQAILPTSTAIYLGGDFTQVNGVARPYLAAITTSGTLTGWAPTPSLSVLSLAQAPNGRILASGRFQTVNGANAPGIVPLDPTTGALYPYPINTIVQDYGTGSAVWSIKVDGSRLLAATYKYGNGTGNYEGFFTADANNGTVNYLGNCAGDNYGITAMNNIVYTVSHHHDCSHIGGQPDYSPRAYQHADSWTYDATGKVIPYNAAAGVNFSNYPSPSEYSWLPDLGVGSFTGATQAAWTVNGSNGYLVLGGEFPKVNGVVQQGLVRFATPDKAPNKQGPVLPGNKLQPVITADGSNNTATVSWASTWDRDNQTLRYELYRSDKGNTPIYTTSGTTQWWNLPTMYYQDQNLTPGSTYSYTIKVFDPNGNRTISSLGTITMPATGTAAINNGRTYDLAVTADSPSHYWKLADAAGTTKLKDELGNSVMITSTGLTAGGTSPFTGVTGATMDGTTNGRAYSYAIEYAPTTFSVEALFKTASKTGGRLMGWSQSITGTSTNSDRMIYMDNAGHLLFGLKASTLTTAASPKAYNDNAWHHVVATVSGSTMSLYVDGALVATTTVNGSQWLYLGNWRLGGDSITGWPAAPTSQDLSANLSDVAVYSTALPQARVVAHYSAFKTVGANQAPTASFTAKSTGLAATFDASASSDPDGTVASYAWDFGDGTTGTGATASHTYAAAGTYQVKLTVTDNAGATGTVTNPVVVAAVANQAPVASFTTTQTALSVTANGSASKDPDGTIASYAWTWGDGTTATGATVTKTYTAAGTYTITLTVTDNAGAKGTITKQVTVSAANRAPVAAFTSTVSGLTATLNGSTSSDPDGTIASYAWNFGDSTTGTGATASHAYKAAGTYTVVLTVTDNAGATNSISKAVTVTAPATTTNTPPTAAFTVVVSGRTVTVDGSASKDPDGTIVAYGWNFGDAATANGAKATHTYTKAGSFIITLAVKDNSGALTMLKKTVTIA